MMIPKIKETKKYPAIIMEFKVRNIKKRRIVGRHCADGTDTD